MSRQKPGRNDPCPCGSGKKYKSCHAAEDRAREAAARPAPAAPAHPLAQDLQSAIELLSSGDTVRVTQALERLTVLLQQWGPQPGLRYEPEAFHAYVSDQLERLKEAVERDPSQAYNQLRVSTLRELGTRGFLDSLRAALVSRATTTPELTSEDRQALCVGALLAAAPKTERFNPEERPVLDVVFSVQFREWGARHGQQLVSKLEALAAAEELPPEAREALRKAGEGELEPLVKYVESDPKLAERISQEARERAARMEAAMRQSNMPSIFAPEEQVWLTCVLWKPLNALKEPTLDAASRSAAVASFLKAIRAALESDKDFLAGLLERTRARAREPSLDEATRGFLTDAAVAFEAEPVRMVLAAILTSHAEPQARSAEEEVVRADLEAKTRWTAEDLEPYRALLEGMNLPAATERLRRAQEWLRAHPIEA